MAIVGLLGLALGASPAFLLAITLIAIDASIISWLSSTQPCGNAKDDVSFWLTAGLAIAAGFLGYFGTAGQNIVITFAAWIYGSTPIAALNCK